MAEVLTRTTMSKRNGARARRPSVSPGHPWRMETGYGMGRELRVGKILPVTIRIKGSFGSTIARIGLRETEWFGVGTSPAPVRACPIVGFDAAARDARRHACSLRMASQPAERPDGAGAKSPERLSGRCDQAAESRQLSGIDIDVESTQPGLDSNAGGRCEPLCKLRAQVDSQDLFDFLLSDPSAQASRSATFQAETGRFFCSSRPEDRVRIALGRPWCIC